MWKLLVICRSSALYYNNLKNKVQTNNNWSEQPLTLIINISSRLPPSRWLQTRIRLCVPPLSLSLSFFLCHLIINLSNYKKPQQNENLWKIKEEKYKINYRFLQLQRVVVYWHEWIPCVWRWFSGHRCSIGWLAIN